MGVYIKGMKMPKNCQECWLYIEGACYAKGYRDYRLIMDTAKPDDCPLVEIPTPHGRLGDFDALKAHYRYSEADSEDERVWMMNIRRAITNAPTIIEAEE